MKYNLRSLEGANHSLLPDSSLGKNVEHTDASKKRGIEGGGFSVIIGSSHLRHFEPFF